ncbi:MAG: dihydrolipoamide acetyltransferase family protein [Acidimicrobiia bacterium]|nr:dihydrolipoamide acetyltransferase family protein [Acidimicrobiia bacterium]
MAYELMLPDIGEGLTEAEIVGWLVEEGSPVAANQPLVEVETDKAVVEIPSPQEGVLLHRGGAAGATIKVGSLLAVIGTEGEQWGEADQEVDEVAATRQPVPAAVASAPTPTTKAMPIVRKLARDRGVDLNTVTGTGPGGKITRQDVEAAAGTSATPAPAPVATEYAGETLTALRKTIARNLSQSWAEIPHVTVWRSVDASQVLAARKETGLLLEAILVRAVLPVLAEFPDFSATFDGVTLRRVETPHIGVAVATPAGLMVPVVRDAATMNLRDLSDEIDRLSTGAQERTLGLGELSGGTFTVSNVGAVGGGFGTPIIPYGTTAIVSIGRAEDEVVARDKAIAIAPMFPVSLSFDHRVIDGAQASQFLVRYAEAIAGYGLAH